MDLFFDKYINISEEEMIKGYVYEECRRMDKADIYEWIYQDELKLKKYKEVIDKLKEELIDSIPKKYEIAEYSIKEIKAILKEVE